jgi:hypothetical protein
MWYDKLNLFFNQKKYESVMHNSRRTNSYRRNQLGPCGPWYAFGRQKFKCGEFTAWLMAYSGSYSLSVGRTISFKIAYWASGQKMLMLRVKNY